VAAATGEPLSSEPVATVVRLGLDPLVAAAVAAGADAALALRRLANEVAGELAGKTDGTAAAIDQGSFVKLVKMEESGDLTSAQSRHVLKVLVAEGGDPAAIAIGLGFERMEAGALEKAVDQVIAANGPEWQRYVAGDDKLSGFLIGKVKAATGGKADLRAAAELLRQRRSG